MHIAGKIMLALGLAMCLIGAVMTAVGVGKGVGDLSGLEDYEFSVENATSGTIEIVDDDGEGDYGVSFWVKGEYVDEDENGIWDVCDDTNITITQHPEVNTEWDEEGKNYTLGDFYYEVLDGFDIHRTSQQIIAIVVVYDTKKKRNDIRFCRWFNKFGKWKVPNWGISVLDHPEIFTPDVINRISKLKEKYNVSEKQNKDEEYDLESKSSADEEEYDQYGLYKNPDE